VLYPWCETFPKYGVGFSRGNYLECGKSGAGVPGQRSRNKVRV